MTSKKKENMLSWRGVFIPISEFIRRRKMGKERQAPAKIEEKKVKPEDMSYTELKESYAQKTGKSGVGKSKAFLIEELSK